MKKTFKKHIKFTLLTGLLLVSAIGCKKEQNSLEKPQMETTKQSSETVKLQTSFAKILANAVKSDEDLRKFLKQESLKEFDNDYDILYQFVKDKEVNNGESFREKLLKSATAQELEIIETNLPLLTIFVPNVPNFNPEIWDPATEKPLVAVSNMDEANSTSLYGGDEVIKLKPTEIPGFPVLVIKQNERVRVKAGINKFASTSSSFGNSSRNLMSFEFIDKAYDGSIPEEKRTSAVSLNSNKLSAVKGATSRIAPAPNLLNPNSIDQINVDAYNSGVEWHRDYVYYGITPSSPNGKFKNNYSEFITSFKFLTPSVLNIIADQDDPKANNHYSTGPVSNAPTTMWTEGNFEFRITVLINAKNGLGNELTKVMSVNPRDLFDLHYEEIAYNPWDGFRLYELRNISTKEFHPNIELVPWDLENYGTAWKFIFYETDNAQETTQTFENTTTYAANFEISQGTLTKIGFKFGASATTVEKKTFSVKTTLASDYLGEATLTFDQPIIIGISGNSYTTREITNGNTLSISVEPRKVF